MVRTRRCSASVTAASVPRAGRSGRMTSQGSLPARSLRMGLPLIPQQHRTSWRMCCALRDRVWIPGRRRFSKAASVAVSAMSGFTLIGRQPSRRVRWARLPTPWDATSSLAAINNNPDTSAGRRLLAHELAHVEQQRDGRPSSREQIFRQVKPDDPEEEERKKRAAEQGKQQTDAGSATGSAAPADDGMDASPAPVTKTHAQPPTEQPKQGEGAAAPAAKAKTGKTGE